VRAAFRHPDAAPAPRASEFRQPAGTERAARDRVVDGVLGRLDVDSALLRRFEPHLSLATEVVQGTADPEIWSRGNDDSADANNDCDYL
jgi:hypothetical protein